MPNVDGGESLPSLSVCVVTYERATHLARCLSALVQQASDILQVVVVDASRRAQRPDLGKSALQVTYIHAPDLAGWMTRSRNEALLHVEGDVIAFLDDDTVVHPGWARAIRRAFGETDAAALAGRTLNHQAGEERYERPIGRLLADGTLTDGFAADAPSRVEVDHGIGANMSFTRDVLAELGGFRDDYPGTALREDTDMFLRVKALGARVLYDPAVVVSHLPAPHVRGARFDTRYKLYGRRNHMVLLTRNRAVVIASDIGGLPEAVGDAGFLFPPGDASVLAEVLEGLASSPQLMEKYRQLGYARAQSMDWSVISRRLEEALA